METLSHPFPPVYDASSRILILGSFPSVKSRETAFFYGHPQNRFWRVIAHCFGEPVPMTTDEKKTLLLRHGLALWDVIESCEIKGSSDASIRDVVPTDIERLIGETHIGRIILNGKTAERYFHRFYPAPRVSVVTAPSTSPANASWSFERLCGMWGEVLK